MTNRVCRIEYNDKIYRQDMTIDELRHIKGLISKIKDIEDGLKRLEKLQEELNLKM